MGCFHDQEKHFEPEPAAVPLVRLNHVSFLCTSVEESVIRRLLPTDARLRADQTAGVPRLQRSMATQSHRYRMGIHLLQRSSDCNGSPVAKPPAPINPKGNHISFQCTDMALMTARLRDMNLEFVTTRVWDGETVVDQLFFHDPDGNVIEICNCENLPVIPLQADSCMISFPSCRCG